MISIRDTKHQCELFLRYIPHHSSNRCNSIYMIRKQWNYHGTHKERSHCGVALDNFLRISSRMSLSNIVCFFSTCSPIVWIPNILQVYQYLVSGDPSSTSMPESSENAPIPLCSVYAYTRGEPPFTNCTPGFTGTLDYILFCPSHNIKPYSFLELPDSSAPDVDGGLPNFSHPSDNLPIGAEFEIIKE